MFDIPTIIILIVIGNAFSVLFILIYKKNKENTNVNLHFILAKLVQLLVLPTTLISSLPLSIGVLLPKTVLLASLLLELWAILLTYKKIKQNYQVIFISYFSLTAVLLIVLYFLTELPAVASLIFSISAALITSVPIFLLAGVGEKTPLLKAFLSIYILATALFVTRAIVATLSLFSVVDTIDYIEKATFVFAFVYMTVTNIGFVLLNVEREDSKLIELASIDYVSKINNRQTFLRLSKECIDRAFNHDRPATLLMFDVDDFKDINDVHGHMVGDEVLYELGQLIKELFEDGCQSVGRFGGDEFAIILPGIDYDQSELMCDRLINGTKTRLFSSKKIKVSISVGVVTINPHKNVTFDTFYRLADEGLYKAKKIPGPAWSRAKFTLTKDEKQEETHL